MIGKLKGLIDSYGEDYVILDVGGVGYQVHCSARTLQALASPGEAAVLSIETYVREDQIKLFGFRSDVEREWFRLLQTVQGVGAKVALAVLGTLPPSELANAIALRDKAGMLGLPVGIGIACYAQGTGLGPFEGATVRVDPQGTVYVLIGVAAQGQGHTTTLAQIAAGELGASLDDVVVLGGDTTLMPYGMGTGGSRVMVNAGPAVARTAAQVRERAAVVAAEIFECAPADVRFEASRAFVTGVPDRTLPLGRLAQAAIRSKTLGASSGEPGLNACTWFYPDTVTWAFGGQACAVEVDVETCRVRLLRHVVLHDPGRAVNPAIVEGQLQGGAAQAIGTALMEEVVYDAQGQLLSGSFMDYLIPTAGEVPKIEIKHLVTPSTVHELGTKGIGEGGTIGATAAIANAVADALSVTDATLPFSPDRVVALIRARTG